jgi:hypothetical protein
LRGKAGRSRTLISVRDKSRLHHGLAVFSGIPTG